MGLRRFLPLAACMAAFAAAAGAPQPGPREDPGKSRGARHWAFQPVKRPEAPAVKNAAWPRNPLDAFILARLENEKIEPAPEADRPTLIRRLYLDLLGLPPSPEEVEDFLRDERPEAYEALVDRLLASPHHAERWARHWLDLARYADSNGYTIDGSRSIWKYRDWVIEALRRDLPFDRFVVAQLAGDLLPDATQEDRVATGFHRNTLRNEEGGTDPEQFRVEAVADRVSTTATVFLGLTAGCARCHDHKYDPLSQREYFQLFAIFNNSDDEALPVSTSQESRELPALETEIAAAEKLLADNEAAVARRQEIWEKEIRDRLEVEWTPLELEWTVEDRSGEPRAYRGAAPAPLAGITAVRLEFVASLGLHLGELRVFAQSEEKGAGASPDSGGVPLPLAVAVSDAPAIASKVEAPVERAIDGDPQSYWASPAGGAFAPAQAIFVLKEGASVAKGARFCLVLQDVVPKPFDRPYRFSVTTAPASTAGIIGDVRRILSRPVAERSPEERERLAAHYRSIDKDRIPLAARVADLRKRQGDLKKSITTTLVLVERKAPRETRIHVRGDFLRLGEKVEGAVPAVLPPLETGGKRPDRLDLARWLVDPKNPLTPRVTVNRLWQAYFGQGIVPTENDFGGQGDPPTHPQLLDWLASELIARGWSQRALHRLIVTSATYRQSSRARPEILELDPANKLLGRQPRLRLEAEVIRDEGLAASGLLSKEIGGPGVYPPQAQGFFKFTQTAKYWKESQGPDRFRRGMYTYFWRSSPYPFLMTFDAPEAMVSCTRRVRSNTPLQALTLANDPAFFEMAQALAGRVLREAGPGDAPRINRLFRLCLARVPEERERDRLRAFLLGERERFARARAEAAAAAAERPAEGVPPAEDAAWTALARVVLNLDEFITRE